MAKDEIAITVGVVILGAIGSTLVIYLLKRALKPTKPTETPKDPQEKAKLRCEAKGGYYDSTTGRCRKNAPPKIIPK